jgi:two-component system CheB/CheR fusion protein
MAVQKKRRAGATGSPADGQGPPQAAAFPIVGIGASAGGLRALERIFAELPERPGAAFVVIQHLDPTRESLTSEILARVAKITVLEVTDHPQVQPNTAYVIPPGKYLSIEQGELRLSEPEQPRFSRMAIDYFLRSLANDQQECAVAVILSGTGSDGALGAAAVKECGGLVIAQDPKTAEFDGMPLRAIGMGVVDRVVAPERIPEEIATCVDYTHLSASIGDERLAESVDTQLLQRALRVLRQHGAQDLRAYKEKTLVRRMRRRASLQRIQTLQDYVDHLEEHPDEAEVLARDLLINVTRFFRDTEAWDELAADAIKPIVASKSADEPIRVWIPACATGEEAYTVAMLLMVELRRANKSCPLQIFATDVAPHAVDMARAGRYPQSIEADGHGRLRGCATFPSAAGNNELQAGRRHGMGPGERPAAYGRGGVQSASHETGHRRAVARSLGRATCCKAGRAFAVAAAVTAREGTGLTLGVLLAQMGDGCLFRMRA